MTSTVPNNYTGTLGADFDLSDLADPRTTLGSELAGLPAVTSDLGVAALVNTAGSATSTALKAAYGLVIAATVTASGALVPGKHNPVDATAGALSMTLPTGAVEGASIGIEKLDSSVNAVTVTGNVRGASGQSISLVWAHETLLLRADSAGSWWPVAGHKTKATLDAAYAARSGPHYIDPTAPAYGADPTGATDSAPAIRAALAAAAAGTTTEFGRRVRLPVGQYRIDSALIIPNRVVLCGAGSRSTTIKAGTAFPTGTPLIELGDPAAGTIAAHDCRVEELSVHCNDIAGSIGVHSSTLNEQGGGRLMQVRNYLDHGILIDSASTIQSGNIAFRDIECYPSSHTTASVGIEFRNVTCNNEITRVSIVPIDGSSTAGANADGILINNSDAVVTSVHIEGTAKGVRFTAGASGAMIGANGNSTVPTLVHLDSTAGKVAVVDARANGSANTIVDQVNTKTISGVSVAVYAIGGMYAEGNVVGGGGTSTLITRVHASANVSIPSGTLTQVIYDTVDRADLTGYSTATGAFVVPTAGWYQISAGVDFAASSAGTRRLLRAERDGTPIARDQRVPGNATQTLSCNVFGAIQCTVGQTLSIKVLQDSGGSLNLDVSNAGVVGAWAMFSRVAS